MLRSYIDDGLESKKISKKIYLLIKYIDELNSNLAWSFLASKTQNHYYYVPTSFFIWYSSSQESSRNRNVLLLQNERESSQEDLSNRIAPNTLHLHNTWAVKRTYESTGNNIVPKWGMVPCMAGLANLC